MKPNKIHDILDVARACRNINENFYPLFIGAPGIGKSQIVQQWCKQRKMPFIDLRAAYLESPDLIGFPSIERKGTRAVTVHNTPEFWPFEGEGVLLLEEPNRGTTSVMNTFMQLLTDRKVHNYELPTGWMIVGCINPDGNEYDVNTMDSALKNRFAIFDVEYDKKSFVDFMYAKNWEKTVIMFIESNTWTYSDPESLGNVPGSKYISPRTFAQVNAILKAGVAGDNEMLLLENILGKNVGRQFFNFRHNEQPVLYSDLIRDKKAALKKLADFCRPKDYKAGYISITIRDIVETNEITDDLLAEVALTLPADQAPALIQELEFKRNDDSILRRLCRTYPKIQERLQSVLMGKLSDGSK